MKIYAFNSHVRLPNCLFEELLKEIDSTYQKRIRRYRFWEDQQRSLIGHLLSRYAIIKNFNLQNEDISIIKGMYGKPHVSDNNNINFNVSHSGNWIVCVINSDIVGIDVQKIEGSEIGFADCFLSQEESDYLFALGEQELIDGIYSIWTLKEAYIKALGVGLVMPMNEFSILKSPNGFDLKSLRDNQFYFKQYNIDEGYKLAVCSKVNNFCEEIHNISIEELAIAIQKKGRI